MAYLYPGAYESTMIHYVLCSWAPSVYRYSSGYMTDNSSIIYCPICKKELRSDNETSMSHENGHLSKMGITNHGKSNDASKLALLKNLKQAADDYRVSKFRKADKKYEVDSQLGHGWPD